MKYLIALCISFAAIATSLYAFSGEKPENVVLESSVRINGKNASCGVIIETEEYDTGTRIKVLSTGHMVNRNEPEIEIFYLNGKKLDKPITTKGHIILLIESNKDKGIDFCLMEADLEVKGIKFIPLADANFTLKKGEPLLSVGCDMGIEPKCFKVKMKEYCKNRGDFTTDGESQGGRSGGGVFTVDGKAVVGVCWGGYVTESKTVFTSHKTILKLLVP